MKIAIAGDSAGEDLAKMLAEHLKDRHEVEISRTDAGPDTFYANLSDRVASEVVAGKYDRAILVRRQRQGHRRSRRQVQRTLIRSALAPHARSE
jgi:ribose 5-phosphate isomerase RpiB